MVPSFSTTRAWCPLELLWNHQHVKETRADLHDEVAVKGPFLKVVGGQQPVIHEPDL
jgi:hypothetical protein